MGGTRKQPSLTTDQATRWTQGLKRVFDEGFISRDMYETLKRKIEERVMPTQVDVDAHDAH